MTSVTPRRVVITGIGAITPIGTGRAGLWAGIKAERSAVRSLTRFDPSIFRSHNAAEVDGFDPADHIDSKRAKRLDLFGQYAVAATPSSASRPRTASGWAP
jgi:3-oxoacyl-[acyl-carrier-protein] synthase II